MKKSKYIWKVLVESIELIFIAYWENKKEYTNNIVVVTFKGLKF